MWFICYSIMRGLHDDMLYSSKGAVAVGTTVLFAIELGFESFLLILLCLYLECIKLSNTKLFLQLDYHVEFLEQPRDDSLLGLQVGEEAILERAMECTNMKYRTCY